MLEIEGLTAGYGGVAVLRDINVKLGAGEFVGLLGANNAGKTTMINSLSGLVKPMAGRILWQGEDITRLAPRERVERGIVQVPEGRLVFPEMSIRENLLLGGINGRARPHRARLMEKVLELFPRLGERLAQNAGSLSGGEQQMLAIGRGLMAEAKVLMLDEPSLGLSPLFVQYIFGIIDKLHAEGLSILLVEQNLNLTLRHAQRCYVLERGQVAVEGGVDAIRNDPRTQRAYLGL
ncbi:MULTISPECIES: ABC transporter ATP-binding protein [Rhodopseudomonas]|uniref:Leucine/isoleucine/valine transporter ATP-binding subunit n=1 Tax=Rhodopseudomonas palustris TaxID=1076 RepID=A0A0D7EM20_RHOPL|nr:MULTISPECIES: ABC transporter ATP-binding protein [Rhodopseudomonas]KIZ41610.1 leucine/isoleucine/valine transporter ATP-binding subunit [Rhodopseudomonas palustris]MDF3812538.1 ABC transporter ATP-binding protein [Rhodopseudomonas sp. BAL398]WOK19874.1 ABC transporter ATP-binding protein [Rhodopseudomonas sp. BAL398]